MYVHVRNLFAVMAPEDDPLQGVLTTLLPEDHLKIGPGQWLVAFGGSAKDLSDKLGVTQGQMGVAVIMTASGYYGRADSSIWEWINSRMGVLEYAS